MIEKLRSGGKGSSTVAAIIHDTMQEMTQLREVEFVKIGREQNKVAHEIAHHALVSG